MTGHLEKTKKTLNIFLISSIILCLTIRVRQHRKYTCKSTFIMIFNNYVTCGGGGGGSLCLMDLGPCLNHMDLGPCLNHIQSLQATR